MSGTVLVVGDRVTSLEPLRRVVETTDRIELVTADSRSAATALLDDHHVECVVTQYDLPDGTGIELFEDVRAAAPDAGCILYADPGESLFEVGDRTLVAEFVPTDSPVAPDRVARLVRTTVEHRTQTAYPLPAAEDERLGALDRYHFDDDRLTSCLERVTRIATTTFDVPFAAVNTVDEHTQEVRVTDGLGQCTIDRQNTLCTHAILDEGVTVVEDVTRDPRVDSTDAIYDDADLHFYAGAPLVTADGLPIGTFCVYDTSPRPFDDADRTALSLFADEAMAWIEALSAPEQSAQPEPTV